jgi:ATP-dependent Clp protease ATP-binding subunit ClpA
MIRERGVGEQAVLIELARRGVAGEPKFLRSKRFVTVDCRRLVAEEIRPAIQALFAALEVEDDLVLCIDGFLTLLSQQGPADNGGLVLSLLARSRGRVIGMMTPHEYEERFAGDTASQDLFSVVHLHEPEREVAERLVRRYADGMQAQYLIRIEDEAVRRAISLADTCILHERLPHKAVKVLKSLCDDAAYDRAERGVAYLGIGEDDVVRKVSELTGVPEATLAGVGEGINYSERLGECVVGQDHAVREVATELGLIKAGLVDGGKPASVMMFIGQTGTGKTELAKVLARLYSPSRRLKTFTLGNYSEPHSVSGIIGVPAGYVGHDQGGRLVNELNADPYSVFLLDEADKAHPDVMQPFLNLFDEGWICDQRGNKAYADRAIFILTTNVGQRQIAELCKQGKSIEEITTTMKESLARIRHPKSNRPVFTAEFLARIKRVVVFRSLDEQAMIGIAERLVAKMREEWAAKRQKDLVVSPDLVEEIGRRAAELNQKSQGKEGGRIVRKLLADLVESKIQATITAAPDEYRRCTNVTIDCEMPAAANASEETAPAIPSAWPPAITVRMDGGEAGHVHGTT